MKRIFPFFVIIIVVLTLIVLFPGPIVSTIKHYLVTFFVSIFVGGTLLTASIIKIFTVLQSSQAKDVSSNIASTVVNSNTFLTSIKNMFSRKKISKEELAEKQKQEDVKIKNELEIIEKFVEDRYKNYIDDRLLKVTIAKERNSVSFGLKDNKALAYLRTYDYEAWSNNGNTWNTRKDISNPEILMRVEQRNLEYFTEKQQAIQTDLERYTLVGRAGSGKTRYLGYRASQMLAENAGKSSTYWSIPIYIRPHKWLEGKHIKRYKKIGKEGILKKLAILELHDVLKNNNVSVRESTVERYLEKKWTGQILLLIDEFDVFLPYNRERRWGDLYKKLKNEINLDINQRISMIIATRILDETLGGDRRVINALLPGDALAFLTSTQINSMSAEEKIAVLRKLDDVRLQTIAAGPLGLLTICFTYMHNAHYSFSRAELYQYSVDAILSRELDQSRSAIPLLNFRHHREKRRLQLLEDIAWKMHSEKKLICNETEIQNILQPEWLTKDGGSPWFAKARNWAKVMWHLKNKNIEEAIIQSGLLVPQRDGMISSYYSFLNLPTQEYLAACSLLRKQKEAEVIVKEYSDPWSEEVILLYLHYLSGKKKKDITSTVNDWFSSKPSSTVPAEAIFTALKRIVGTLMAGYGITILRLKDSNKNLSDKIKLYLFQHLQDAHSLFIRENIAKVVTPFLPRGEVSRNDLITLLQEVNANPAILQDLPDIVATLTRWIALMDEHMSLNPVELPYLQDGIITDELNDLRDISANTLKDRLQNVSPQQAELLLSVLIVLNRRDLVPTLTTLLKNVDGEVKRASIVRTLGQLGDAEHIQTLIVHLQSGDPKFTPLVKWHIVDALGILGERFGYWIEQIASIPPPTIPPPITIKEALLKCVNNETGKENPLVLLRTHMTFVTKYYHFNDRNSKQKDENAGYKLDSAWLSSEAVAISFRRIIDAFYKEEAYVPTITNKLQGITSMSPPPSSEQLIYACDIVGQFANFNDALLLDEMAKSFFKEAVCPGRAMSPPSTCSYSTLCTEMSCPNYQVKEHVENAKWLAMKRRRVG